MKTLQLAILASLGALAATAPSGSLRSAVAFEPRPAATGQDSASLRTEGGLVAQGAPIELSRALDGGLVTPTPAGFLLTGRGYRADVDAGGLRFQPILLGTSVAEAGQASHLALTLRSLVTASGEHELIPSGPPVQPRGAQGEAVVTPYADAALAQLVTARPEGVQLELVLTRRPAQAGELRIVYALQASLAELRVETTRGESEVLRLSGAGAVSIGSALAIDAAGVETGLALTLRPDELAIVLPAELLESARFPLRIDPLIGTQIDVSGPPGTKDIAPDVAFDPFSGEYIVAWERPTSPTTGEIWAARIGQAGSLSKGPFLIDATTGALVAKPRVAVEPATGKYLVAYEFTPSGSPATVRWCLFDSTDVLVGVDAFIVSGYTADRVPDVGFVKGATGQSGFVLASRRDGSTSPDATIQVTWINAFTALVIDSKTVTAGAPPRDGAPAIAQLADANPTLVAFQRFDSTTFDADVQASCVTLGASTVTLGAPQNVSSDPSGADGLPDVGSGSGTFQVAWEHVVTAASNRNIRGREVVNACSGLGTAIDISSLSLLELTPSVAPGRYTGPCDGHALVLFKASAAPAGTSPASILSHRWSSGAGLVGPMEILKQSTPGISYSSPRGALDSTSTTRPEFLVVFDDDGFGTNNSANVVGQLYTFDQIPVAVAVSPSATTKCVGGSVTFSAGVTGTGTFTYQWRHNGTPIGGATAATLDVLNLTPGDAGAYDVVLTGTCGTLISTASTLTVEQQITSVAVSGPTQGCQGALITLASAVTGGSGTFSYIWLKNGTPISGATSSSYVIPAMQPADAGTYRVAVLSTCTPVASQDHVLGILQAPSGVSVTGPASQCVLTSWTLQSAVQSGAMPFTYQWRKDGAPIAGQTGDSLTIAALQAGDAGKYKVDVTNTCGTSSSPDHDLMVNGPPGSVTVSASGGGCLNSSVTFNSTVQGSIGILIYQWFKDAAPIPGANGDSYTIPSLQPSDAGKYSVVAGNACGPATSPELDFQVAEPPAGVAVTAPGTACPGSPVTFQASVQSGTAPFTYQWSKDGQAIAGATAVSYTIASVSSADSGQYKVDATNACSTTSSPDHAFQASELPGGVTVQASTTTTCSGPPNTVTFSASVASGSGPFQYQWLKNGAAIPGATSITLVLDPVQPTDGGSYSVRASNACGSTTSTPVTLQVLDTPLVAALGAGGASVALSWPWSPSTCASVTEFHVFRTDLTLPGPPELIEIVPQSGLTCYQLTDDGGGTIPHAAPLTGRVYSYVVEARDGTNAFPSLEVLVQPTASALSGDVTGDGRVDGRDLIAVALAQGGCQGTPPWNPAANAAPGQACAGSPTVCGLTGAPELIDLDDLQVVLDAFGTKIPTP